MPCDGASSFHTHFCFAMPFCGRTSRPARRTLVQVKLEDIAATEEIFTTLMGEDVESRRKFIEENALDVKNLAI